MDENRRPRSPEERGRAATQERPRRPGGPQPPRRQSGTASSQARARQQRLAQQDAQDRHPAANARSEPQRPAAQTRREPDPRERRPQPRRTPPRERSEAQPRTRTREQGAAKPDERRRQQAKKPEREKTVPKRKKKKPHRIYNTNFGFKFVTMLAVVGVIVLAMLIFFKVKHINVVQTGVNNTKVLASDVTPRNGTETTSPAEVSAASDESENEFAEPSATEDAAQAASGEDVFSESETAPVQTEAEIVAASGISIDDNLLSLSKAAVASQIHAKLPYINEIQIRKKLPNTVIITVSEFTVTYGIQDEHGLWWLISREGRVLERANEQSVKGHLTVTGMPIETPQIGDYIKPVATPGADLSEIAAKRDATVAVLPLLEQSSFAKEIVSLDVSTSYDLILWYGTQYEIKLGNTENLSYKLNYLASVLAELGAEKSGTIDLTFTEDNKGHFLPFG